MLGCFCPIPLAFGQKPLRVCASRAASRCATSRNPAWRLPPRPPTAGRGRRCPSARPETQPLLKRPSKPGSSFSQQPRFRRGFPASVPRQCLLPSKACEYMLSPPGKKAALGSILSTLWRDDGGGWGGRGGVVWRLFFFSAHSAEVGSKVLSPHSAPTQILFINLRSAVAQELKAQRH